jgi:hypothetical protein
MADQFQPKPEHKFTFGLWTVGSVGRDPFGEPVRERMTPRSALMASTCTTTTWCPLMPRQLNATAS